MKKRIVILTLCVAMTSAIYAQHPALDRPLKAYLDFCLAEREALNPLDCSKLERCIEESDAISFVYHGTKIVLAENSTFKDLTCDTVSMKNHAFFRPEYIDSVLIDCVVPENIDEPTMKRGTENCYIQHRALEALGKGVYSYEGAGDMQLFVVADYGYVRVTVCNEAGAAQSFNMTAESTESFPAAVLKWEMSDVGKVIITIENMSEKPVGFVIASN